MQIKGTTFFFFFFAFHKQTKGNANEGQVNPFSFVLGKGLINRTFPEGKQNTRENQNLTIFASYSFSFSLLSLFLISQSLLLVGHDRGCQLTFFFFLYIKLLVSHLLCSSLCSLSQASLCLVPVKVFLNWASKIVIQSLAAGTRVQK